MTWEQAVIFVVFPVAGYLLGSVPFAWVIGKIKGVDIRTVGSKNIGATNLGRTLGPKFFWYAFLLDAAKGFFPVLLCALLIRRWQTHTIGLDLSALPAVPLWAPLITAAACMLGHLFPIWLKFKGGKGVATGFGVVLGFWPWYTLAGLMAGVFFVLVLMVYRYISLASMTAACAFFVLVIWLTWPTNWLLGQSPAIRSSDRAALIAVAGAFVTMIVWRHRTNIVRLYKGTESRIGQREIEKSKMRPHDDQSGKGDSSG